MANSYNCPLQFTTGYELLAVNFVDILYQVKIFYQTATQFLAIDKNTDLWYIYPLIQRKYS